jgi:uncharacterized SAM-binding protein YcdF (DUF218 family)
MFFAKKLISHFLFPLPFCMLLSVTGLLLLWFTARQKTGKWLVSIGTLLLLLCSYGVVSERLLAPFENRYPVYQPEEGLAAGIKYVVVLGGGHVSDERLPCSSRATDDTLKRLVEAVRIQRSIPGAQLVLSGGSWIDPVSDARVMAGVAEGLGVRKEEMVLEEESRDTREEVLVLKPMIGTNRFVLVTSASHMPRSMALFRREGLEPIPAPADHLVREMPLEISRFFPHPKDLYKAHRAAYEAMGLVWGRLRGEL